MHKGVILLIEASSREGAKIKSKEFMEDYKDSVWDFWLIGGRWSGLLTGYEPSENPANIETCWLCNGTGLRDDALGQQARAKDPEYTCNGCDGKGKAVKFYGKWEEHAGDILSLSEAMLKVEEWKQDYKEAGQQRLDEAKDWLNEEKRGDISEKGRYSMYGYVLKAAGEIFAQNFCFECNVFNIEKRDYSIPEGPEGWWAVIVDMHN